MPRLKIESEKSLYPPIEVEIDGQVFSLQRVTQKMLMEIGRLDEEIPKGNLEAAWKRLEVLFGPNELFSKLAIFQVRALIKRSENDAASLLPHREAEKVNKEIEKLELAFYEAEHEEEIEEAERDM